MKFFMDEPPASSALLRLVLDSDELGSKERVRCAISLDDVIVSGRKHVIRASLGTTVGTSVQLIACILGENDEEPPLVGAGSPWTQGGASRTSVGTQTVITGSGRVQMSPNDMWAPNHSTTMDLAASVGDANDTDLSSTALSSPQLKRSAAPVTAGVGRVTLDPNCGVARDIALVKSLMAAWPIDEVEGMLVYVEKLRREKEELEAQLMRKTLDIARAAAREMAHTPLSVEGRQAAGSSAPRARLLEPTFADEPEAEELVSRVTLIHGQPLSREQKKHLLQHYDSL